MNPNYYVTVGDVRGVGLDLILIAKKLLKQEFDPIIVGPSIILKHRAKQLNLINEYNKLHIFEPPCLPKDPYRNPGETAICALDWATEQLNKNPGFLLTAPIHKKAMHEAGFNFPGHTEYLAYRAGVSKVYMMMASPKLKVLLATIHEALSCIPALLSKNKLIEVLNIAAKVCLQDFNIKNPKIAVAGLNPHAGEGGLFGNEEITKIAPAIQWVKSFYKNVSFIGPKPPDTIFFEALNNGYDMVVAMYHDQGLAPLKTIAFHETVNVTLGLPYVRTSPDHGTAIELAGTGKVNPSSFIAAWNLGKLMVNNRNKRF